MATGEVQLDRVQHILQFPNTAGNMLAHLEHIVAEGKGSQFGFVSDPHIVKPEVLREAQEKTAEIQAAVRRLLTENRLPQDFIDGYNLVAEVYRIGSSDFNPARYFR